MRWFLIAGFIIWLAFAISSFFVVNKPVGATIAEDLSAAISAAGVAPTIAAEALLDLGAAIWISVAGFGVGLPLWCRLAGDRQDNVTTLVFASGLGFGALGLLTLALGLVGLTSRAFFASVLAALTLLTAPGAISFARRLRWKRPPGIIGLYLFVTLSMVLLLALLPPTSWDGLFYHLKGPKLFLQSGRIYAGVDIPHLNFPSLFEMLLLLGMGLRSDVAGKLTHLVYTLLLGGTVYLLATRVLKLRNGWLSLVFLYSTPLVLVLAAWAYNDLALSFYAIAALYAFLRWEASASDRWLVIAGIFSGLMMSMKYTAVVPALFFMLMLVWRLRRNLRSSLRPLLLFALPAAALVAPWLLKNWAFTGNPVYPFLFEGRFWDAFRAAEYGNLGTGIGFDVPALLRLPYDATLGYADASQEATIGPFYLLFLPLMVMYGITELRKQVPAALKTILAYSLVSYLFWTIGVINSAGLWQARLMLPGIIALCPVLAWILEDLSRFNHRAFSLQRFLRLVIVFVAGLLLLSQFNSWLQTNPLAYFSGAETRSQYLSRRLGVHYEVMTEINAQLDEESTVVFLWEPRSYYCDLDCRPDSILDRLEHLRYLHGDAGAIAAHWREEEVTHVLVYEVGLDFIANHGEDPLSDEELATMQTIREQYLAPVRVWDGSYSLYRLDK